MSPDTINDDRKEGSFGSNVNGAILQEIHQGVDHLILRQDSFQLLNVFDLNDSRQHSNTFDQGGKSGVASQRAQDLLILLDENGHFELALVNGSVVKNLKAKVETFIFKM